MIEAEPHWGGMRRYVTFIASLPAALREAAQVFVHCNSLLCEYGNHTDLCKQLRAALEGTK